jgi:hypothetical protein
MKTMTIMSADSRRGKTGPQRTTKLAKGFSCLALAATVTTGYAFASDRSYDQLGQAVVASFECATLAAHAKYRDEEVRLTAYGLSTGRAFVEAYRAGRVPTADFSRVDLILPLVLRTWSIHQKLDVPVDFAVGGIYQEIWSRTTSDLGDRSRKMKERQSDYSVWAQADFRQKNCSFVGK